MSETNKLYQCPKCGSLEVYAGFKIIDQIFRVIQIYAGCNECRSQWDGVVQR